MHDFDHAPLSEIRLTTLLRGPRSGFALGMSLTLGGALCTIPLYGVHGVGSAFVLGLVLPFVSAMHFASLRSASEQGERSGLGPLGRQWRLACAVAVAHVLLPGSLLALNALRIRQCEPIEGLGYILLGPLSGTLLATVLAVPLCRASERPRMRLALCALPPLLGLIDFAHNFYATPAVFAYGHFFGYFPGPIYDTVDSLPAPLLWLRLASLLLALSVVSLVYGYDRWRRSGGSLYRVRRIQLGFAALASVVCLHAFGPALGFDATTAHIRDTLGVTLQSPGSRCLVHLHREYAHPGQFLEDCDVRVRQVERFFGLTQPEPITVYLFRDAVEKQALMGAGHTNIAKPWRHEIYLQESAGSPHPVMAHEVAHVVAGQVGVGPFRVAGRLFGMWPNPGLIEGMATAADPRPVGDLTPHQWARAALDARLSPPLPTLLGSGFFNQQTQLAYTLTGSFLRYMHDSSGRKALLRYYRTGDPQLSFGADLTQLEQRWHAFLRDLAMPAVATALAQQRFMGHSALSAVCPNELARLHRELWSDLQRGDLFWAQRQCRAMLAIDPTNLGIRSTLAAVVAKSGNFPYAEREAQTLRATGASDTLLRDTRQAIADAHYYHGHLEQARAVYDALLAEPQSHENRRLLQVKRIGLEGGPIQRRILRDLLIGRSSHRRGTLPEPIDGVLAVYLTRELRTVRDDGLPHYLEARQHLLAGHDRSALVLLQEGRRLGLPTQELALEAERLLAASLLQLDRIQEAKTIYQRLLVHENAAVRWEAEDSLARIELMDPLP